MKKIFGSIFTIGIVLAVGIMAVNAFFSDTETSTGNVFAAGAIDLQVDNTSYGFDWNDPSNENPTGEWGQNQANSWTLDDLTDQLFFDFHDLKPGDYGEDTISLHVNDNDAWACMAFNLTGTPENGLTEPESEVDETDGEDEGELQNYLSFLFWYDDGDNVLEAGEEVIEELSDLPEQAFTGGWLAIADSENADLPLEGDTTHFIGKGWCFGEILPDPVPQAAHPEGPTADNTGFTCSGAEGDHNDAQTDGIVVDVGFYAVQSRNNESFTCSSLPPLEEEQPLVGAALDEYTAPNEADCDLTVDDTESIQTDGIDQATADQTVCVGPGTYDEDVTISTEGVTLAGDGAMATSTINGDVLVQADNVTLTGFDINGFVDVYDHDNVTVSYNHVESSGGIDYRHGSATIGGTIMHNVVIASANLGIYLDHDGVDDFTATYNTVTARKNGFGSGSSGTWQYNVFSGYDSAGNAAIETFHDSGDVAPVISFNNFNESGETGKAVDNSSGNEVYDAPDNWWGEADPTGHFLNVTASSPAGALYPEN